LLVGVSKYKPRTPRSVGDLNFPAIDAAGIRDALIDAKGGGLPDSNVLLLTDEAATKSAIMDAVASEDSEKGFLKAHVKKGDKVIVFLAGHGIAKGVGASAKSYFLSHDVTGVTTKALDNSAVGLRDLMNKLGELPASQFTVFIDACREDPTPGRGLKGNQNTDVMTRDAQVLSKSDDIRASSVTFFACAIGQRAFEDESFGHGVFTYYILDGIKEAAVPRADGTVDLGGLATYVRQKVSAWAKEASRNGDTEFDQTPDPVLSEVADDSNTDNGSVALLRVRRAISETPLAATPPVLHLDTLPSGARVSINGEVRGHSPLQISMPQAGTYALKVEASGYAPVERQIKLLAGLERPVFISLSPAGRGVAGSTPPVSDSGTPPTTAVVDAKDDLLAAALEDERAGRIGDAIRGLNAAIAANPKLALAYEHLANLQFRLGGDQARSGLSTLSRLMTQVPTAHSNALYARAAAMAAIRERELITPTVGKKGRVKETPPVPLAGVALQAALRAVSLDRTSDEAQEALGLALIASDEGGKNQMAAMNAFSQARILNSTRAENFRASGFGILYYAKSNADVASRTNSLNLAVKMLNRALALRPDSFEAHLTLAYCFHLLNQTEAALREYELASAYRGEASDANEVAGIDVALAGLHRDAAANSTGAKKEGHEQASQGYVEDAKETSPNGDLKIAMRGLVAVGLAPRLTSLSSFLPSGAQEILTIANNPVGAIQDQIEGKINNPLGSILGRFPAPRPSRSR
jgi:hypothetical protein